MKRNEDPVANSSKEGTITALTVQKRNSERVNVFLDGQFGFGLSSAVAGNLHIGQTLTAEKIDQLQQLDKVEIAKQAAYRLISYRPRTVAEIKKRLRSKGYAEAVIEQVVDKLRSIDLLDDEAFGRYWIEQRETFKPRSRFALRQELREKGVPERVIERLLSELDEEASARRAASKRLQRWENLPREEFLRKMSGHLRRRGFDFDVIRQITDEMWQSLAETAGDDIAS
jgi:regulatory protein